jgi:hypothetical protein
MSNLRAGLVAFFVVVAAGFPMALILSSGAFIGRAFHATVNADASALQDLVARQQDINEQLKVINEQLRAVNGNRLAAIPKGGTP